MLFRCTIITFIVELCNDDRRAGVSLVLLRIRLVLGLRLVLLGIRGARLFLVRESLVELTVGILRLVLGLCLVLVHGALVEHDRMFVPSILPQLATDDRVHVQNFLTLARAVGVRVVAERML